MSISILQSLLAWRPIPEAGERQCSLSDLGTSLFFLPTTFHSFGFTFMRVVHSVCVCLFLFLHLFSVFHPFSSVSVWISVILVYNHLEGVIFVEVLHICY